MIPKRWTCHVCLDERPDEQISVRTLDISSRWDLPDGTAKFNIRYCNDRDKCRQTAEAATVEDYEYTIGGGKRP